MTRKDLEAFKARVQVGTVLRCVENTYSRDVHGVNRAGLLATITGPGVNVMGATADGKPWRWEWPSRLRDVIEVTGNRITYKIGRGEHTATWEIVA